MGTGTQRWETPPGAVPGTPAAPEELSKVLLLCCHRAAKDSYGLIPNALFFYPSWTVYAAACTRGF